MQRSETYDNPDLRRLCLPPQGFGKIVGLFEDALKKYDLENDVTLAGSFCTGRCNREGVTISVDDDVYTGITPEGFNNFFEEKVLKRIREERV